MIDFRILEGEEGNQHDVTFAYNSNYHLYVTLEHARVISQGRVPTSSANQLALAGQTVTGMNYLERPQPGGYFIYSDLSVRHEGKYRLSFQLYEESKDPMDADVSDAPIDPSLGTGKFLTGRFEVKSAPFIVYSAKKFPGLMESTQLSRTIADQGCRVRIRRDVRMRRRDQLNSMKDDNWDDYDDEAADSKARQEAEPEAVNVEKIERPASQSNGSAPTQPQRRPSAQGLNQQHQNSYMPPPPQQYAPPTQSSYETTPISPYAPNGQYMQQPQMTHQNQFPQPQYPYQNQGMPQVPHPPHYMPLQSPTYEQYYAQSMYNQQQGIPPNYAYSQQYNPSQSMVSMGQNMHAGYGPIPQPPYQQQQSMYSPSNHIIPPQSTALPPLKPVDPLLPKPELPSPNLLSLTDMARHKPPPPPPPPLYPTYRANAPIPQPPPQYISAGNGIGKRSFGAVFDTQHMSTPMHSGARPTDSPQGIGIVSIDQDGSDEDFDYEQMKMRYRRADGTEISRRWPPCK